MAVCCGSCSVLPRLLGKPLAVERSSWISAGQLHDCNGSRHFLSFGYSGKVASERIVMLIGIRTPFLHLRTLRARLRGFPRRFAELGCLEEEIFIGVRLCMLTEINGSSLLRKKSTFSQTMRLSSPQLGESFIQRFIHRYSGLICVCIPACKTLHWHVALGRSLRPGQCVETWSSISRETSAHSASMFQHYPTCFLERCGEFLHCHTMPLFRSSIYDALEESTIERRMCQRARISSICVNSARHL